MNAAFSRPIDAGQLLRQRHRGGLIRQWTAPARQPACATGASIKHRPHVVAECPQPLACLHVPWRKLVWARPDDDSRGCSGQRAELPSRRCGSRSRVGLKHFRCPRQRSSTGIRPASTPSRHRRRRPWPIKRIFHAPSAPYLQQIFPRPGHSGVFRNPVPPSQTSPWATASMPTSSQNGFACLPRKPRLSSQRSSRCLLKCSARVRMLKRAAAIMSLIQSARNNGHDPYAYLRMC